MRKWSLALVCSSLFALACAEPSSSSDTGETAGDGDGECVPPDVVAVTPAPIDPACLVDTPCVEDSNCPAGYVCNGALAPPACSQIYCGAEGTPCSSTGACASGLTCDAGICNPCDVCGDECSVDFETDPNHCGCCDNPVPDSGSCVDGAPGCPVGMADCDGVCLNVTDDPNNCGGCGNVVGDGAECIDGEVVCASPDQSVCSNDCVDLTSDEHCGGCDQACPDTSDGCSSGYCEAVSTTAVSCDEACSDIGLVCAADGEHVAYYINGSNDLYLPIASCDTVPPPSEPCEGVYCTFLNVRCFCTF